MTRQRRWMIRAAGIASNQPCTGGAQFVMGDGSVKFLTETMSAKTFRLMNYIHDGNPVEFEN